MNKINIHVNVKIYRKKNKFEKFEDTKGVIKSRKSEDRQYHGQK